MLKNRFFTLVMIAVMVAVMALTVREAVATSGITPDSGAQEAQRLQRSRAADAARWNAMRAYYERLEESQIQRSRAADAARWNAMKAYYERLEESRIQRSWAADAARWNAMVKLYSLMTPAAP